VRTTGWVLVILIVLGWLATELQFRPRIDVPRVESPWRRTVDGWERRAWLPPEFSVQPPAVHPAMLGFVQALVSVAALVAFPALMIRSSRRRPDPLQSTPHSRRTMGELFRFRQWKKRPQPHHLATIRPERDRRVSASR